MREDVFYLVSEAVQHTLGGLTVEADRLQTSKLGRAGEWEGITFNHLFMDDPVVLSSAMRQGERSEGAVGIEVRRAQP